jgi:broad specificity phosphatase PhoE
MSLQHSTSIDGEMNLLTPGEKTVIFVRHGEGLHNVLETPNRLQIYDPELTEKGVKQAKVIGEKILQRFVPDAVIVSPLERTLHTATVAFEDFVHKIPFIANELCRETLATKECNFRNSISSKLSRYPHVSFEGIPDAEHLEGADIRETIEDQMEAMIDRARNFLDYLETRAEEKIVVVTHGRFIVALTSAVVGINKHHAFMIPMIDNCETVTIKYGPAGRPPVASRGKVWNLYDDVTILSSSSEYSWF